jgi:hypothetical protein
MKHVREEIPDVQRGRPEVSAALAAVVDTATAKRPEDRYANDAELIADLEDVLAIETARAGSATGEVTSVLRTLPARKQRRVPFPVRHRVVALALVVIAFAVVGGGVVWLATRTHHGTGKLSVNPPPTPTSHHQLQQVTLCQSCAHGFNPLGNPTDEHPDAGLAIDNQTTTYWSTQTYYSAQLEKAGVGLYVDAYPGTAARKLQIITGTPGFSATIYARNSPPPLVWPDAGWVQLAPSTVINAKQEIDLTGGTTRYRYYLVWITTLGGHESLQLNEVTLYH